MDLISKFHCTDSITLSLSFSPCPNEGHDGGGRGEPEIRAWKNIHKGRLHRGGEGVQKSVDFMANSTNADKGGRGS